MAAIKESYLNFVEEIAFGRLTKTWNVQSFDECLGQVRWFSINRKYCFYPAYQTIYDSGCLKEISDFLEEQTHNHKYGEKS